MSVVSALCKCCSSMHRENSTLCNEQLCKINCQKLQFWGLHSVIMLDNGLGWFSPGADPGMGRSGPGSSFWQLNHANSACFEAISANFIPNFDTRPPLFANPGSDPDLARQSWLWTNILCCYGVEDWGIFLMECSLRRNIPSPPQKGKK